MNPSWDSRHRVRPHRKRASIGAPFNRPPGPLARCRASMRKCLCEPVWLASLHERADASPVPAVWSCRRDRDMRRNAMRPASAWKLALIGAGIVGLVLAATATLRGGGPQTVLTRIRSLLGAKSRARPPRCPPQPVTRRRTRAFRSSRTSRSTIAAMNTPPRSRRRSRTRHR